MVIYTVKININETIHDEWLNWMISEHIPEVMNTGCFSAYGIFKLLLPETHSGITYVIQYECRSSEDYLKYREKFASTLQAKHSEKFDGKFTAERSLMEKLG